ncbi:hypothetical protein AB8D53_03640 [Salmonella enterica]
MNKLVELFCDVDDFCLAFISHPHLVTFLVTHLAFSSISGSQTRFHQKAKAQIIHYYNKKKEAPSP